MADKIVVMQGGHIEQMGAPLDLYDNPANIFVAGFIGSPAMNLIPGRVKDGAVEALGARLPLSEKVQDGREVVYGVRPEHLRLAETGITGTVAVVEPTGSETHVVIRAGGQELVGLFRERHGFRPGQEVILAPDPGAVHLFDKETGVRL